MINKMPRKSRKCQFRGVPAWKVKKSRKVLVTEPRDTVSVNAEPASTSRHELRLQPSLVSEESEPSSVTSTGTATNLSKQLSCSEALMTVQKCPTGFQPVKVSMQSSMTARSSSLAQFLQQYGTPSERGRFFTRSQIFIAYRAFLSQTKSSELLTMDYAIFSSEFEEEMKHIQLQTKQLGRSKYYKLFKSEKVDADAKKSGGSTMNDKSNVKILLNDLNIYLCCKLCCGYLVDATTITECLHSFCKSCIVKHLQFNQSCPVCNTSITSTGSNPLSSLKADIVLQDIVYKLLPGVAENEQKRVDEFEIENEGSRSVASKLPQVYKPRCLVTVILEWVGKESCTEHAEDLVQKYIRTSDEATVAHLAQFVLQKLEKLDKSLHPTMACDILIGGVILPSILTIRQICSNGLDFESRKGLPVFKYNLKPLTENLT